MKDDESTGSGPTLETLRKSLRTAAIKALESGKLTAFVDDPRITAEVQQEAKVLKKAEVVEEISQIQKGKGRRARVQAPEPGCHRCDQDDDG